jgi:hypothetical protein
MKSELLSTSRSNALAYICQTVRNGFPTLDANTVDTIKLASLALILDGKPLGDDDVIAVADRFEDIANRGEDGPWLYVCPRDFFLLLAELSPSRMPAVAQAWALTEEAQLDQWTEPETTEFLKVLSKFCAKTDADENSLFLFVSL